MRDADELRGCLTLLCDAGWPGDLELATSLIWKYAAFCDFLGVHLDLRSTGVPLASSYSFEERRGDGSLPPKGDELAELFDQLVEEGSVSLMSALRFSLAAWTGASGIPHRATDGSNLSE